MVGQHMLDLDSLPIHLPQTLGGLGLQIEPNAISVSHLGVELPVGPLAASLTVNAVAIGVEVLAEQAVKQLSLCRVGDSQYEIALGLLALIRFHNLLSALPHHTWCWCRESLGGDPGSLTAQSQQHTPGNLVKFEPGGAQPQQGWRNLIRSNIVRHRCISHDCLG